MTFHLTNTCVYCMKSSYSENVNLGFQVSVCYSPQIQNAFSADLVRACVKVCFDLLRSRIEEENPMVKNLSVSGFPMKGTRRDWFKSLR